MSSSGNVTSPTCADGDDIAAGAEEDEKESGTVSVAAAASCRILKHVVGVESTIMTMKQQSKQVNPSSQFCVGDGQLSFSRILRSCCSQSGRSNKAPDRDLTYFLAPWHSPSNRWRQPLARVATGNCYSLACTTATVNHNNNLRHQHLVEIATS